MEIHVRGSEFRLYKSRRPPDAVIADSIRRVDERTDGQSMTSWIFVAKRPSASSSTS